MKTFSVQMVGEVDIGLLEAHSASDAVVAAAGCEWLDVGLPIWACVLVFDYDAGRRVPSVPAHPVGTECYMPRDNSGRQWLVREAKQ